MFLKLLMISSCFLMILGCNKPNPNPENLDPIYQFYLSEQKSLESQLTAEKKTLEENRAAIELVKPQTGQIKYARKKVYDSEARVQQLEQRIKYLKIRSNSRLNDTREKYLRAFNEGKPWPDPKEYEEFLVQKRLENAPKVWNVKSRLEESNNKSSKPKATQQH
jgi:hypothetical protein